MKEKLAIFGGPPVIKDPLPHFRWPPPIPKLSEIISRYIEAGYPLSIVDRSGIYQKLEDRLCNLHNRRYGILTSSGTMALYSAFFGLDLKPGDEVISTVYSFHATAAPLLHFGVKIKFCDVEADTGNIDASRLKALISQRTRAVVTNHMWGHPVDVDSIRKICTLNNLAWVEDCSHAHFAEYKDKYVGMSGDAAVFSLQGNKLLTGGEGGILLTDSTDLYERATLLGHSLMRSINCVKGSHWQGIKRTGFGLKLRMHPLAAVIVLYLLDNHCFDWIKSRRETLERFALGLSATGKILPPVQRDYVTSMGAYYGFKPRINFNTLAVSREKLVEALAAEGLDVSVPGSQPFHRLPIFNHRRFQIGDFEKADNSHRHFPGADAYYAAILSLPTFTFSEDWPLVDRYIEAFHKVLSSLEELK
jgi:dTDP-4-amino-4,6-dideoxygalactose transaminase